MSFSWHSQKMHTKEPFGISRGTYSEVTDLIVEIGDGIGEGAPHKFFNDTLETFTPDLDKVTRYFEDKDLFQIEELLKDIDHMTHSKVVKCALDMALYDHVGKQLGVPVYKLLGLSSDKTPQTSFTIGISDTEDMVRKALDAKDFPILKIKLGGKDDLNVMRRIRESLPNHVLRVDCNCGWTSENALPQIDALAELGIEFVEQPLPPDDIEGAKKIFAQSKLPIYLDESICTTSDIPKVAPYCHGVNFKLVKTGGIRECLRGIHTARACGLKVMIGCMLESSIGITAAAHLTPLVDCADLDGNILLADDPFDGMKLENGWIKLPERPGLGVVPV